MKRDLPATSQLPKDLSIRSLPYLTASPCCIETKSTLGADAYVGALWLTRRRGGRH